MAVCWLLSSCCTCSMNQLGCHCLLSPVCCYCTHHGMISLVVAAAALDSLHHLHQLEPWLTYTWARDRDRSNSYTAFRTLHLICAHSAIAITPSRNTMALFATRRLVACVASRWTVAAVKPCVATAQSTCWLARAHTKHATTTHGHHRWSSSTTTTAKSDSDSDSSGSRFKVTADGVEGLNYTPGTEETIRKENHIQMVMVMVMVIACGMRLT